MSQPSQWERAQMEMRERCAQAMEARKVTASEFYGKLLRALPLSPPPGEEKPMDRLSRMNAEAQARVALPLGHPFKPCDRPAERCEGPDACHELGCRALRSAHVAAHPEKGEK
jgi:hypothetical protein